MFQGHFIPLPSQPGQPGSKLDGAGSIDVTAQGIRIRGTAPHRWVTPLSIGLGVLSTLVVIGIVTAIEDASAGRDISLKLSAVMGIVGGLLGGYGASLILGRLLPATPLDRTVTRVTGLRVAGDMVSFVVDDPALGGQLGFRTTQAAELHALLSR